jgi:hypothetical protein
MIIYLINSYHIVRAESGWEELFQMKKEGTEITIKLKDRSYKKKIKEGETILNFTLQTTLKESKGESRVRADYEVHCTKRNAYRVKFEIEQDELKKFPFLFRSSSREQLTGKDYDDFRDIMQVLCAR